MYRKRETRLSVQGIKIGLVSRGLFLQQQMFVLPLFSILHIWAYLCSTECLLRLYSCLVQWVLEVFCTLVILALLFWGWSFHQPVAILKSRRQPQVVLNTTKPPRTFLLAWCGTAVTCPEPDAVQEAELERKTLGVSLEKAEHRYQPKNPMVLLLFSHCSLLLRLHLQRCCEGSLACGPCVWLTCVKNYEKSICSRCF